MANHQLDADDARATVTEVNDDIAIQTRMLGTVILGLKADAEKLLELRALDNRVNFVAGMLSNALPAELERMIHHLASFHDTLAAYRNNL